MKYSGSFGESQENYMQNKRLAKVSKSLPSAHVHIFSNRCCKSHMGVVKQSTSIGRGNRRSENSEEDAVRNGIIELHSKRP